MLHFWSISLVYWQNKADKSCRETSQKGDKLIWEFFDVFLNHKEFVVFDGFRVCLPSNASFLPIPPMPKRKEFVTLVKLVTASQYKTFFWSNSLPLKNIGGEAKDEKARECLEAIDFVDVNCSQKIRRKNQRKLFLNNKKVFHQTNCKVLGKLKNTKPLK